MPRAGLTAARLTEAAAELADEAGLDGVTVAALARRFGVKDASLYSHVRNRRDLLVRVALHSGAEMTARIADAVAGRAGEDALVGFAGAYRAYALEHPGRYAATQMRMAPEEVGDAVALRRSVDLTHGMLRAYGLAEPDLTDAGRLLRAAFHGYVHLELGGGFAHPRAVQESWDRGLAALHVLLENWPSRPERTPR
ncbi:TetR/AcrR family transcriptional regulator [Actinomadura parmotrematis]|uniref:WHG domain-containing protein n=1 Tax=Actinomadura parmotrematis TaxID=2864039 RepID=A0ABS7FVZ1_9ACTN|nr:TetR/AcrR family transcriptional regulator [Actinomadura parmotrematis]MBW8483849.1 WHG domain-containing protein [Actinomadura parmotrematis]